MYEVWYMKKTLKFGYLQEEEPNWAIFGRALSAKQLLSISQSLPNGSHLLPSYHPNIRLGLQFRVDMETSKNWVHFETSNIGELNIWFQAYCNNHSVCLELQDKDLLRYNGGVATNL